MSATPASSSIFQIIYQTLMPVAVGVCVYVVYKQGKQLEAILLALIGGMAVFYYYLKWFKAPVSPEDVIWPPFVSTCPDYLTLISPSTTGAADPANSYCVDFVGVSMNPSLMKKSNPNNPPKPTDPDFEAHVFKLSGLAGANVNSPDMTTQLCASVLQRGLTWAHICDPTP
jgi:hypothetical protein